MGTTGNTRRRARHTGPGTSRGGLALRNALRALVHAVVAVPALQRLERGVEPGVMEFESGRHVDLDGVDIVFELLEDLERGADEFGPGVLGGAQDFPRCASCASAIAAT